jgi:hypothetical protein
VSRELAQQHVDLIQEPTVAVHDLATGSNQHRESVAIRIRPARRRGLEGAGQVRVSEQLTGDGLSVDSIALPTSGKPAPPVGSARGTHISDVGSISD